MSQLGANDDGPDETGDNRNPAGQSSPASEDAPGVKLGRIGMILAIIPFTAFLGLCCSILAMVLSRQVGVPNKRALIGMIVGAAWLAVGVLANSIFN